ncbi:MAG TPA: CpaF family protein [Alphaproteobacteria bacterium]|nr:CpaF family protein [Alphaproteobacteria bacterium]
MSFGRRNGGTLELLPSARAARLVLAASPGSGSESERPQSNTAPESAAWMAAARPRLLQALRAEPVFADLKALPRAALAEQIGARVRAEADKDRIALDSLDARRLVTALINELLSTPPASPAPQAPFPLEPAPTAHAAIPSDPIEIAKEKIQPKLMARLDAGAASALPRNELARQLGELVAEIIAEEKFQLNGIEQRNLVTRLVNDMLGLGPLEPLLADEKVTDIMVNGPHMVYAERAGKLELTNVRFRDDPHVMNIATRIVSRIGRRIDESNPLCDARLSDGSRVNIIIPPLAIDGPSISIRKFSKKKLTLDLMTLQGNLSPQMASVLKIAGRSRLNILLSGGTGSGKTTLLNAISQMIDPGERIVTIEDAAELQLQQPHVVRLETRPANLEGNGEITMRDLIRNALRMRPDRIILGEVRGAEAVDMLQAMNTGHEGSLGTIHANRPREALTRLENMIGLAGINLMAKAVRTQIATAIDMIVQVSRMRDGVRRVTQIMEVIGMEGDVVTTQDLFHFEITGEAPDGRLIGRFVSSGLRPHCMPKAAYFGLDKALLEAMG